MLRWGSGCCQPPERSQPGRLQEAVAACSWTRGKDPVEGLVVIACSGWCQPYFLPACLWHSINTQVADWGQLRQRKSFDMMQAYPSTGLQPSSFVPTSQAPQQPTDTSAGAASAAAAASLPPSLPNSSAPVPLLSAVPAATTADRQSGGGARQVGKVTKATKAKSGGRTFTSKYRGVHQTFPTRRWEAQFRYQLSQALRYCVFSRCLSWPVHCWCKISCPACASSHLHGWADCGHCCIAS